MNMKVVASGSILVSLPIYDNFGDTYIGKKN